MDGMGRSHCNLGAAGRLHPGVPDIDAGKIAIFVPVRAALLGLRVGQSIDWALPSGQKHRYRVVAVPYQPEAAGASG